MECRFLSLWKDGTAEVQDIVDKIKDLTCRIMFLPGATTANNSLFTYPEGKNHASYFDAAYLPKFLDQEDLVFNNATLGQQALHVCENNKQCLFDIHTTGKISIGKASKQAMETFITFVNETETPGKICYEKEVYFKFELH